MNERKTNSNDYNHNNDHNAEEKIQQEKIFRKAKNKDGCGIRKEEYDKKAGT